ncbi:starvation-inducible protein [Vibrio sp. UCD-FRSSP16_10]|uniref:Slp family lipoprotein n=1 Tax=unclassified Vibrio TaxID=2614977 RepID=UPI00080001F7|nr:MULTISPECIES: Slp family lipoprotein [unclassified Vibrio]OBT08560.1 starvation-inducible protein [Vibrio sp. UCD-FRSSP16_30]OBT18090.1 starvation-inducible protein [Vibrio sp. UCD-FRSSP16_10]
MSVCKLLVISILGIIMTGCSALPETLVSSDDKKVVTDYETWINNPTDKTSEIRLGGVIAKVTNLESRTRLEMVNLPIKKDGKPNISVEPQGRFVAYIDGFIDPTTFAEGRLVTVLGHPDSDEEGKVGEFEYRFPVLNATGYHLWQIREKLIVHDQPVSRFPCRSLHCRDARYGPTTGYVIQSVE